MERRRIMLIAMLILQLVLLIAVNRLFVGDMREDIDAMKQELAVNGMSPQQANTIGSTLSTTKANVSAYVLLTGLIVIGINGAAAQWISKKQANPFNSRSEG